MSFLVKEITLAELPKDDVLSIVTHSYDYDDDFGWGHYVRVNGRAYTDCVGCLQHMYPLSWAGRKIVLYEWAREEQPWTHHQRKCEFQGKKVGEELKK